jgi:hypothetical protein
MDMRLIKRRRRRDYRDENQFLGLRTANSFICWYRRQATTNYESWWTPSALGGASPGAVIVAKTEPSVPPSPVMLPPPTAPSDGPDALQAPRLSRVGIHEASAIQVTNCSCFFRQQTVVLFL